MLGGQNINETSLRRRINLELTNGDALMAQNLVSTVKRTGGFNPSISEDEALRLIVHSAAISK